jgi:hypothetical protein
LGFGCAAERWNIRISDDLDRSVSFGSISTTNVKKLLTDFKLNPVERSKPFDQKLKINLRLKNEEEEQELQDRRK